MYKQSTAPLYDVYDEINTDVDTRDYKFDRERETNPLPSALTLSLIGGLGGFGASFLTKNQKKHKLRNTILGATALPAAYLLLGRKNKSLNWYNRFVQELLDTPRYVKMDGKHPIKTIGERLDAARYFASEHKGRPGSYQYSSPGYKIQDGDFDNYKSEPTVEALRKDMDNLNKRRIATDRKYRNTGLGLAGVSGLLGLVGMGSHWRDTMEDKYGPPPEGVDEFAYYDFMKKQDQEKKNKELEEQKKKELQELFANVPDNISPQAYKEFLMEQYNISPQIYEELMKS